MKTIIMKLASTGLFLKKIRRYCALRYQIYQIKRSGYFDKQYYLINNKDVSTSKISAERHYIIYGASEHRNPSTLFHTKYYLEAYPDVIQSGINPLIHYIRYGKKEGRAPVPQFSGHDKKRSWYRRFLSKIGIGSKRTFQKWIHNDDIEWIRKSPYFDENLYLSINPDIKGSGIDPAMHYLMHGWKEGRSPGYHFDPNFYLQTYPDVIEMGINPLLHYLKVGHKEGRMPKAFEVNESKLLSMANIISLDYDTEPSVSLKTGIICSVNKLEEMDELLLHIHQNLSPQLWVVAASDDFREVVTEKIKFQYPHAEIEFIPCMGMPGYIHSLYTISRKFINQLDLVFVMFDTVYDAGFNNTRIRAHYQRQMLGSKWVIRNIINEFIKDPDLGILLPIPVEDHSVDYSTTPATNKNQNSQSLFADLIKEIEDDYRNLIIADRSYYLLRPGTLDGFFNGSGLSAYSECKDDEEVNISEHILHKNLTWHIEKTGYSQRTFYYREEDILHNPQAGKFLPLAKSKILFVSHDMALAGAQKILLQIVRWLSEHTGIEAHVLYIQKGMDGGRLLPAFKNYARVYHWEQLVNQRTETEAAEILFHETGKIDLIYGNTIKSVALYDALQVFDAPFITHIHELENSIRTLATQEILQSFRKWSAHVIACSVPVKENLLAHHFHDESRLSLIHEFITSREHHTFDKEEIRKQLGLPAHHNIVWGCGTVSHRKGSDLFIQTAIEVKKRYDGDFIFIWIGDNHWKAESTSKSWSYWESEIKKNEMEDWIQFIGMRGNPELYFQAGDLFYLPSREDPFPLVCLEAADSGLPIVCFDDAGGIPDLVEDDAGKTVPYLDIEQAAEAIISLFLQKEDRLRRGKVARNKVKIRYNADLAVRSIWNICRKVAKKDYPLSIIIPVYNQGPFLYERLHSIFYQTFLDFEVIIMDDASTDHSYEVACQFLQYSNIRIVRNQNNSGSAFRQWKKGISIAEGKLIWIAEGDDVAEYQFLEKLLPVFKDENIVLAYANSVVINENSERIDDYTSYYETLDPSYWNKSHTNTLENELNMGLGVKNTIPNVSAVLFRKDYLDDEVLSDVEEFRFCGDWYLYVTILKRKSLYYCNELLNMHRKHGNTITTQSNSAEFFKDVLIREQEYVQLYIMNNFPVDLRYVERWEKFHNIQSEAYYNITGKKPDPSDNPFSLLKEEIREKVIAKTISKSILFITTNDFSSNGGSEQLWHKVAIEMKKRGYTVHVVIKHWETSPSFIPEFEILGIGIIHKSSTQFETVDKISPDFAVISLGDQDEGLDWYTYFKNSKLPYVIINQLTKEPVYWPIRMDINDEVRAGYLNASKTLFTGRNNIRVMGKRLGCTLPNADVIYNPYDVPLNTEIPFPKMEDGIHLAIPAALSRLHKGQHVAFEVLKKQKWKDRPVYLHLYGSGKDEKVLRDQAIEYGLEKVVFHGFTSDILSVWKANHGILLPSFMEGLPLALVGALICGRVPIVTDIGAHKEVIDDNVTGFIASFPTVDALDEAMERAYQRIHEWEDIGMKARDKIHSILPEDPIHYCLDKISYLLND